MKISKTKLVRTGTIVCFAFLAVAFSMNLTGHQAARKAIPLVDTNFLSTETVRRSYSALLKAGEDMSDFDCYGCHEKDKPPPLRFDKNLNLIIPQEHSNIVMHHGSHERNNNCFNCHDENNLSLFQTRDRRKVTFSDSQLLCGSCHGPTYRDWEAGVHGRTGGYWDTKLGAMDRKVCVDCHDPHSPTFPGRKPAPGPHPLHSVVSASSEPQSNH